MSNEQEQGSSASAKDQSMEFLEAEFKDGIIRKRRGRPTKLNIALAEKIFFMAAKGMTDQEICYLIGINEDTINTWKSSPSFSESINKAKEKANGVVERALHRLCLGMTVKKITEVQDAEGNVLRVIEETKELPPNFRACQFWLINRSPEWKWPSQVVNQQIYQDQRGSTQNFSCNLDMSKLTPEQQKMKEALENALGHKLEEEDNDG